MAAPEGHHRLGAVTGGGAAEPGLLDGEADHIANMGFVIDDEDTMRHGRSYCCLYWISSKLPTVLSMDMERLASR